MDLSKHRLVVGGIVYALQKKPSYISISCDTCRGHGIDLNTSEVCAECGGKGIELIKVNMEYKIEEAVVIHVQWDTQYDSAKNKKASKHPSKYKYGVYVDYVGIKYKNTGEEDVLSTKFIQPDRKTAEKVKKSLSKNLKKTVTKKSKDKIVSAIKQKEQELALLQRYLGEYVVMETL